MRKAGVNRCDRIRHGSVYTRESQCAFLRVRRTKEVVWSFGLHGDEQPLDSWVNKIFENSEGMAIAVNCGGYIKLSPAIWFIL